MHCNFGTKIHGFFHHLLIGDPIRRENLPWRICLSEAPEVRQDHGQGTGSTRHAQGFGMDGWTGGGDVTKHA